MRNRGDSMPLDEIGRKRLLRRARMQRLKSLAEAADRRGDEVARLQAADRWRALATDAEAARAPRALWWTGRGGS